MKYLSVIFICLIVVSACSKGKENDSTAHAISNVEPQSMEEQIQTQEPKNNEVNRTLFDLIPLENMGIHLLGKSNLTDLGNPPVIYCSNTDSLNFEKIEMLNQLKQFLIDEELSYFLIDLIKIDKNILSKMIQNSILLLETDPYSRFCPQIYLSI